jgi:hypothetical protein
VAEWLEQACGVKLAEAKLSEISRLRPAGISGQFEVATAYIVVRGERGTGHLVVTERNGAEIL